MERPEVIGIGQSRLLVGLAQGLVLLVLKAIVDAHAWPETLNWLFAGLVLVAAYLPLTILAALGALRPRVLFIWTILVGAVLLGVAAHSVLREAAGTQAGPSFPVLLLSVIGLFIAYHLVAAGEAEGKLIASYRSYFDTGWKSGVRLALSLAFTGVFWLVLGLGAGLFALIGLNQVREVIEQDWFYIPATTLAFAAAVHLSDVRVALINGIRSVGSVLLSWLLPIMAVLAIAFLGALIVVGLEPLWATRSATALLLTAAATLIVLINAAYQDGSEETRPHAVIRLAARLAALTLVPLVGIAAYALWLRIDQHGLTPDRVIAGATVVVAALYAAGYMLAAIWPGQWLKPIEATNISSAFVALGVLLALLSPIGDPARLAVEDQLHRLQRGIATVKDFDFDFLRFNSGRYGLNALERLARDRSSSRAQEIAQIAQATLRSTARHAPPELPKHELLATKILVHPKGATLPESFLKQDWPPDASSPTTCAKAATNESPCEAFFADFDGDNVAEVLVSSSYRVDVFRLSREGTWVWMGHFEPSECGGIVTALRAGRFRLVTPTLRELEIDGKRVRMRACQ